MMLKSEKDEIEVFLCPDAKTLKDEKENHEKQKALALALPSNPSNDSTSKTTFVSPKTSVCINKSSH